MLTREGKSLKQAYQKAFEESFIDNYEGWHDVLGSINSLIKMISEKSKKAHKTYSYDDFCRLVKEVIDDVVQGIDWDKMVLDESRRRKKEASKGTYLRNSKKRTKHNFEAMESEVLSICFEQTMKSSLGESTYLKYRKQIEQRNNEIVL